MRWPVSVTRCGLMEVYWGGGVIVTTTNTISTILAEGLMMWSPGLTRAQLELNLVLIY